MRPELIEATRMIQEGDGQSIEGALERLQNTVYAFSMKVCGHAQDAEDNMQEVLYRSLPHLKKISDPKRIGGLALHRHQEPVFGGLDDALSTPHERCCRLTS